MGLCHLGIRVQSLGCFGALRVPSSGLQGFLCRVSAFFGLRVAVDPEVEGSAQGSGLVGFRLVWGLM